MKLSQTKSLLATLAVIGTSSIASAATISHTIGAAPASVDLTAEGTQDWLLIDFDSANDATDIFAIHNEKTGGSGITLGSGFNTDINGSRNTITDGLRGPDYNYTDGTSPASEAGIKMDVARDETGGYNNVIKSYSFTFDAIAVGVEHTAKVYVTTGRTAWNSVTATWDNADPTALSTSAAALNDVYTLTYTPDSLTDDVTVTFTARSSPLESGAWRLGFTGATLDVVVPEPGSLALLGLGGLLIGTRRRRDA